MEIRPAKSSDALSIARVYIKTWQETYQGIVPDQFLDAMTLGRAQRVYQRYLQNGLGIWYAAVAEEGQVVGYISGGPHRTGESIYEGEIYELYVIKEYQRQGLGGHLAAAFAEQLDRSGLHSLLVWVLEQNPGRCFYEKINGIYQGSGRIHFAGTILKAAAYGWISTDLITRP